MISDRLCPAPPASVPLVCFILDTDLSVVSGPADEEAWPVAIVQSMQTCVRRALVRGRSSFVPAGVGRRWFVVPFRDEGSPRIAVFTGERA